MTKYGELSNGQKYFFWFLPLSTIITIIAFAIFAIYFQDLIIIFGFFYFPIIIAFLDGLLGTYFYFRNRYKKVTPIILLVVVIATYLSVYIYYEYINLTIPFTPTFIVGILTLWGVAIFMFIFVELISSFFISRFLNPIISKEHDIKEVALCYEAKDIESNKIIDSYYLILSQIFNYTIKTPRRFDNEKHIGILLRANPIEHVFLDFLKEDKKLFILPFKLRNFIEINYNINESRSIENFLSIFFNFNKTEAKSMEWNDFKINFLQTIKPIPKDKLETIKVFLKPIVFTIGFILFLIAILFNTDFLLKFLAKIDIYTIFTMVIGGILTIIVIGFLKIIGKKPLNFVINKFSKK